MRVIGKVRVHIRWRMRVRNMTAMKGMFLQTTMVEARPTRYQRPRELVKVYRALRFVSELHLKM